MQATRRMQLGPLAAGASIPAQTVACPVVALVVALPQTEPQTRVASQAEAAPTVQATAGTQTAPQTQEAVWVQAVEGPTAPPLERRPMRPPLCRSRVVPHSPMPHWRTKQRLEQRSAPRILNEPHPPWPGLVHSARPGRGHPARPERGHSARPERHSTRPAWADLGHATALS
jgi:hypothetical protein